MTTKVYRCTPNEIDAINFYRNNQKGIYKELPRLKEELKAYASVGVIERLCGEDSSFHKLIDQGLIDNQLVKDIKGAMENGDDILVVGKESNKDIRIKLLEAMIWELGELYTMLLYKSADIKIHLPSYKLFSINNSYEVRYKDKYLLERGVGGIRVLLDELNNNTLEIIEMSKVPIILLIDRACIGINRSVEKPPENAYYQDIYPDRKKEITAIVFDRSCKQFKCLKTNVYDLRNEVYNY